MSNVNFAIEPYDHEIPMIQDVLEAISKKQAKSLHLETLRQEIIGRFAEIGFVCEITVYTTNQDGMYAFDLNITDRTDPKPFDHERQAHEVRNDILGISQPGILGPDGRLLN